MHWIRAKADRLDRWTTDGQSFGARLTGGAITLLLVGGLLASGIGFVAAMFTVGTWIGEHL